ncbi:MAG: carboxyltransferase domain-containing protein [Thermomicrobiales bacterium]
MSGLPIAIRELADSTLLVQTGAEPVITAGRAAATNRLARDLIDRNLPGVLDIVPSYTTILIEFDLLRTDIDALTEAIRIDAATIEEGDAAPRRLVTIPVLYGGDGGLIDRGGRLSRDDPAASRRSPQQRHLFRGGGRVLAWLRVPARLPPELTIPRRSTPRVRCRRGASPPQAAKPLHHANSRRLVDSRQNAGTPVRFAASGAARTNRDGALLRSIDSTFIALEARCGGR